MRRGMLRCEDTSCSDDWAAKGKATTAPTPQPTYLEPILVCASRHEDLVVVSDMVANVVVDAIHPRILHGINSMQLWAMMSLDSTILSMLTTDVDAIFEIGLELRTGVGAKLLVTSSWTLTPSNAVKARVGGYRSLQGDARR
ncbi:hypothetical protein CHU98_g11100 [Xylaria longipes]|nr:hypothetical protein CHU98_g11100 [Xylaria longipes]